MEGPGRTLFTSRGHFVEGISSWRETDCREPHHVTRSKETSESSMETQLFLCVL